MKRAIELLDEYESGIGLPPHSPPGSESELNKYFSFDRDVIEAMSAEECATTAYRLAQFSFYFQREVNRETAREKWAKSQLDDTISKELSGYDKFTKHDVKISMICQENSYAKTLRSIQIKAEQRVTRLTYLSSSIKNLSDTMMAIQKVKVARKYE